MYSVHTYVQVLWGGGGNETAPTTGWVIWRIIPAIDASRLQSMYIRLFLGSRKHRWKSQRSTNVNGQILNSYFPTFIISWQSRSVQNHHNGPINALEKESAGIPVGCSKAKKAALDVQETHLDHKRSQRLGIDEIVIEDESLSVLISVNTVSHWISGLKNLLLNMVSCVGTLC